MAFLGKAHLILGDIPFALDLSAAGAYERWSRAILPNSSQLITGNPGENLPEHELRWDVTNFIGEGQKIIDITNPDSPAQFYRSEGLDFRIPGEFKLNRSAVLQRPVHTGGGGTTTYQGNADFTDETGTSTASGTDRRLNTINDQIQTGTITPGAGTVQLDFYAYHEAVQVTTTQGSSFDVKQGTGAVSGTDHTLETAGTVVGTADVSGLTAGSVYRVRFYTKLSASMAGYTKPTIKCQIVDTTDTTATSPTVIATSSTTAVSSTASTLQATLNFTAATSGIYQFRYILVSAGSTTGVRALADYVDYGLDTSAANQVAIAVYDDSGASTVITQTLTLTATAAGSLVGSVTFASVAATNYRWRFKYIAGNQRPWLDKVISNIQTSGSDLVWNIECADLGQGGNVWIAGHNATGIVTTWTYNFSTEAWTNRVSPASTTNMKTLAMAHTDAYEYLLLDNRVVWQLTTSAANAYISATTGTGRGIAVCQNRLFVLAEDSTNGVNLYLYALDQTSYPVAISNTVTVSAAKNTPDATLRQRIVGTPTGARYFVNHADGSAIIYECDSSPSTPTNRIVAVLDEGVKATAITYTGGKTIIAGQYFDPESGVSKQVGLWIIDEAGYLREVGLPRRDSLSTAHIQMLRAYQDSIWFQQGDRLWRWSKRTGGLYLEHVFPMTTPANARALSVTGTHTFSASDEGVWVTGSVGTYRQSGSTEFISSIHDFGVPGTRKVLWAVEVVCDTLATGASVAIQYDADQTGTWTNLGTMSTGTHQQFYPSTGASTVLFNTLQIRAVPQSADGTVTPVVKAIVVRALPIHDQHFLDCRVLLTDQDSSFHIAGQQLTGGELAAHLWQLKARGTVITVEDGFMHSEPNINALYLARIEAISQDNESPGSGSALVRMRLLAEAV